MLSEAEKQNLTEQLQNNVVVVEFTKKNGEFRKMSCTLKPDMIPTVPVSESTRKQPTTNCSVWDVEAQGWRSFIWDNVQSFSVE